MSAYIIHACDDTESLTSGQWSDARWAIERIARVASDNKCRVMVPAEKGQRGICVMLNEPAEPLVQQFVRNQLDSLEKRFFKHAPDSTALTMIIIP